MGNTGYKSFASLELYYTDDNSYAGTTKANVSTDPDYIAPVLDTVTCAPSARYYNTVRTLDATKNDCSSGYTGSTVTLTANTNQFVSTINVADANAQADSWLAANVQPYANSLGTCELVNDTTAPTAPTLSYSSVTPTALTLSWTSSTDNIGVVGYDVYKNGVLLDSTVSTTLTYNVTGLSGTTTYSFYVKVRDAAENSTISNTLNITTPGETVLSLANDAGNIRIDGLDFYDIRQGNNASNTYVNPTIYYAAGASLVDSAYRIDRMYMGFNTTGVNATSAKLSFSVSYNSIDNAKNFILVKTPTEYPANHVWTSADFTGDPAFFEIISQPVNVTADFIGDLNFPLNAEGLNYINNNNDATFILMDFDFDYGGSAPEAEELEEVIEGDRTSFKLIYS